MENLLKLELYKIISNKVFWGISLVYMLFAILMTRGDTPMITGQDGFLISANLFPILIFVIYLMLSLTIVEDFSTGAISDMVAFGYRRFEIYFSKNIVFMLACVLINLVFPLATVLVATIRNGLGVEFQEYSSYFLRSISLSILLYASIAAFYMCIAYSVKKKKVFIVIGIFIYLTYPMIFGIPVEWIQNINEKIVFSQYQVIYQHDLSKDQLVPFLFVSLGTLIICNIIGYVLFKYRDI